MILHRSIDMERSISDSFDPHFNMSLLNVHAGLLDRLSHLEPMQNHRKPPPAKHGHIDLLTLLQALSLINEAHLKQFIYQLLRLGNPI